MSKQAFHLQDADPLESVGRRVRFNAGQFLWHEGDRARHLFRICSGRVRIIQSSGSRQVLIHLSGPGETIGEAPLFDGGGYPVSAVAASATECIAVDGDVLLSILPAHPELARGLLENMSRRVRHLVGRLRHQTIGTVRSRLAASLLGASTIAGTSTVHMGTQASWAEDIGTVRESLARELSTLRKEKVVERIGRTGYRILDEVRLEREVRVE